VTGLPATGLLVIAVAGPFLILALASFEVASLARTGHTPGQVIQLWTRDHPIMAALLALFVGAFAAHIWWHS
jgi:hypothetical protein